MTKEMNEKINTVPNIHDFSIYRSRRDHALKKIGSNGVAVIFSAPERIRSGDTLYPYRQDSYFYYLTGFDEPDSILILEGKSRQSILFCRDKDIERETWDGFRYGPDQAKIDFSFDQAYSSKNWQETIIPFIKDHQRIFGLWDLYHRRETQLLKQWYALREQQWQGGVCPDACIDLRSILNSMRLIKDEHELTLMRYAASVSAHGHIRAMQQARAGLFEFQVEAEIVHEFCQRGARAVAYNSIVASGLHACTLHYVNNNGVIQNGDLLLIDAGAEYGNYAGDITRTFPINGHFSPAQKRIYEVVLQANKEVIDSIKVGVQYQTISDLAIKILTQGLIDLGLLRGNLQDNIEQKAYRRFYMHGIGHWLGLDVHDVGTRFENGESIHFKENMCLTVEPGLYIPNDEDIPQAYRGIGIRIEDNIIVQKSGVEVMTDEVPKEINEIENLMND